MKQTHCIFPKRYRKSVQQFALTHQGEKNQSSKKTNSPPPKTHPPLLGRTSRESGIGVLGIVNNPQISKPGVILGVYKISNSLSCKAKTRQSHAQSITSEPSKRIKHTFSSTIIPQIIHLTVALSKLKQAQVAELYQ